MTMGKRTLQHFELFSSGGTIESELSCLWTLENKIEDLELGMRGTKNQAISNIGNCRISEQKKHTATTKEPMSSPLSPEEATQGGHPELPENSLGLLGQLWTLTASVLRPFLRSLDRLAAVIHKCGLFGDSCNKKSHRWSKIIQTHQQGGRKAGKQASNRAGRQAWMQAGRGGWPAEGSRQAGRQAGR